MAETDDSADRGAHPRTISSVAVMVCTYRRPELLAAFLDSVDRLTVPAGIDVHVVVADNNPESHYDLYIRRLLADLRFPCLYGHEPRPGYANARNKALELALQTPAEILAFGDDDMTLDPDWLAGHLRSYHEFGCDVVGGAIHGRKGGRHALGRRFAHGQLCQTQGAGNVSFRRWLVAPDGLGLRFDPAFNKTGREDRAFFSQAHALGARIVFSAYPVIHDPAAGGAGWQWELENKADVSAAMQRNAIVALRQERGMAAALAGALWGLRFGAKAAAALAGAAANGLLGPPERARQKRLSAYKNWRKMVEGFNGLAGDYVARYEVRRSRSDGAGKEKGGGGGGAPLSPPLLFAPPLAAGEKAQRCCCWRCCMVPPWPAGRARF